MALNKKTLENSSLTEEAIYQLHKYLQACDYAGYDPYDGLESRVFQVLPLKRAKWARLVWIQLVRRSPINLRPLLLVPQGRNPKGIALCASALLKLGWVWRDTRYTDEARALLDWLITHHAKRYSGYSWGYNFDWQSRSFFTPKDMPNAICTIFTASAFLDAYEQLGEPEHLEIARKSCHFILEHLSAAKGNELYIRYIPGSEAQVHNVNLLGAALLARIYTHTEEKRFLETAQKAVTFSIRRQNADGSWYYGTAVNQRWIDNFHTGFNLVALARYRQYTADRTFKEALYRGYEFWNRHFFLSDGTPKYYHNWLYPIDIHCAAQGILTYLEFVKEDGQVLERAQRIAAWSIKHMRSPKGFFYYQKHRRYTISIPYVRWAQAWMFYALSALLWKLSQESTVSANQQ